MTIRPPFSDGKNFPAMVSAGSVPGCILVDSTQSPCWFSCQCEHWAASWDVPSPRPSSLQYVQQSPAQRPQSAKKYGTRPAAGVELAAVKNSHGAGPAGPAAKIIKELKGQLQAVYAEDDELDASA